MALVNVEISPALEVPLAIRTAPREDRGMQLLSRLVRLLAGPLRRPRDVDLERWWRRPEDWQGSRIRARGRLRVFGEGSDEHFAIEDERRFRAGLDADADSLRPFVDQEVVVDGIATFTPEVGYRIEVYRVRQG